MLQSIFERQRRLDSFWLALGFLTVLPVRQVEMQNDGLGRAARWFPIVGLIIGVLLSGAYWLAHRWLPDLVVGAIVVALWAALTGGLHLDGFADCCDGLLATTTTERRLEIMRDSRSGAFAVIGVSILLLIKTSALSELPSALPALLLAPLWARWGILLTARQPQARTGGLGAEFAAGLGTRDMLISLIAPAMISFMFLRWQVFAAIMIVHLSIWGIVRLAHNRLNGVTGDVYGMAVEVSETVFLLTFVFGQR